MLLFMAPSHRTRRLLLLLLLVAIPIGIPAPAGAQDSLVAADTVQALVASARHPWARWPDFARHVDVVKRLYDQRAGALLWSDGIPLPSAARAAIAQLLAASDHGLDPRDYDAATLDSLSRRLELSPTGMAERARFDVLLTVDLVRYLDDLRLGRLHPNPLSAAGDAPPADLAGFIAGAVAGDRASDSLAGLVAALEPQFAQYRDLRALLARYRTLAADSTLVPLPAGPPVHPGEPYAALAKLRHTLIALGDLALDSAGAPGDLYEGATAAAVRRFQQRHALEPDGILGRQTREALNTPLAHRVEQIELALERLRWVPPIGGRRFLVVNIPAFQLLAFEPEAAGGPSLTMRVVVGRALDQRTPVLLEELRYVEFRPYWNVPRSILVKEIIPRLQRDPGYLSANQMEIVGAKDRVVGDEVTPAVLARLQGGELRVRQRPGPANALGLVKFVFPNAADVYMHGTPQTELFARARRDFSHGCIRLEEPTALAQWVLDDRTEWSPERIDSALAGPGTTRVLLVRPMPVLVFYTTAVARADGSASFYSDVYKLDRKLVEALRAGPGPP